MKTVGGPQGEWVGRARRASHVWATAVSILVLAACTHGSAAPSPTSASPNAQAVATLCRDVEAIVGTLDPLLDRLDDRTEDAARFTADALRVDQQSRQLYRDTAPFANPAGRAVFRLTAGLVADLSSLVFQEFGPRTDPRTVPRTTIEKVRTDLDGLREAMSNGVLACGGATPSP